MPSKNTFTIEGNEIHIFREGWNHSAVITSNDNYNEIITNVTWSINNEYLFNKKLGYLHCYVMKVWYGEDVYNEMKQKDWVVDHIGHDKFDCRISNLELLLKRLNTAKGQKLDIDRERLFPNISLNIYKDFYTGNYQLSIIFNSEAYFLCNDGSVKKLLIIKLLYDCDYRIVISDAEKVLDMLDIYHRFNINELSYCDYKIEEPIPLQLTEKEIYEINNEGRVFVERDGKTYAILGLGLNLFETGFEEGWEKPDTE